MPLPAGVVAALMSAGNATSVLGSVADYASLAFTVADHLKAQEGLKYNSHAFALTRPVRAATPPPASDAGRRPSGSSAGAPPPKPKPPEEKGAFLELLTIQGDDAKVVFGSQVHFVTDPSGAQAEVHVIHPRSVQGFDTAIGDQAEVEFSGQKAGGGYVLSARGSVNEFGSGFFHFWCDFLIRPGGSPIQPLRHELSGSGGTIRQLSQEFVITF